MPFAFLLSVFEVNPESESGDAETSLPIASGMSDRFSMTVKDDSQDINHLLRAILCISTEPFEYFNEGLIHNLLTDRPTEYYQFVKDELSDIAIGRSQIDLPTKQVFSDPNSASDFRVMPCVVRGAKGVRKTVKLVGTNIRQQLVPQVTVGKALVIHPEENFVSHIFEACLLSSARTGICAAFAIDLLSTSHTKITLFGAGRVGYYAALYAVAIGGVREICLCDLDSERAEQTSNLLSKQFPEVRFSVKKSHELSDTDVLVLATTSTKPICNPPGLGANLIISLGADTDYQSELDPAWAKITDIFVDTKDSARFGDLKAWKKAGLISNEDIVDLLELMRKGVPIPSTRQRVFVSTGSALFDNITIGYLLSRPYSRLYNTYVETSEIKSSYL